MHAVSLFSNCGAGDVGYHKAGFQFDVLAELNDRRLSVAMLNHPKAVGVKGDLRQTWTRVVEEYRKKLGNISPALVAACPPCQGLSTARYDRGLAADPDAGVRDARNLLVTVIANVTKALKPTVLVVENVQAFLTKQIRHPKDSSAISAARYLIDELASEYVVYPVATDLCDYGVPQRRKRSFLTFINYDSSACDYLAEKSLTPYPMPLFASDNGGTAVTLRHALESFKLPSLDASSSHLASSTRGGGLHAVPIWEDRRYAVVAAIPKGSGRSAWQNNRCEECGKTNAPPTAATCPLCGGPLLRPVVKSRNGRFRLIHGFHTSTYRRIRPDSPCATITTASGRIGSNNTIHPFENRLLSTYECALLQTFPRTFLWGDALEKWGHTVIREMIGEAVPPMFTKAHGMVLASLIQGRKPRKVLSESDPRCAIARRRLGLQAADTPSKQP